MRVRGVYILYLFILLFALVGNVFTFDIAQAKTRVEVNIFYPGSESNISTINSFQSQLGINFTSVSWYQNWEESFNPTVARNYHNNGYIPVLTWEPQLNNGTGISFTDVTNGVYDSYLTNYAKSVASLGSNLRISLAPEMNTDWTPWGMGSQGNNASNFKTFWQHTVNIFKNNGATNVTWIWSPNVRPNNAAALYGSYGNIYPGDSYVDYMGLDGYNWGTTQSWSIWQSFSDIYKSSYDELVSVSGKGIMIMEIASTEAGGDKAAWITDMFKQLESNFSHIKGFTWFNIKKETDWRINSSEASKQSFIAGYLSTSTASSSNSSSSTQTKSGATTATNKTVKPASPTASTPNISTPSTNSVPTADQQFPVQKPVAKKLAGTIVSSSQDSKASFNRSQEFAIVMLLTLCFSFIGYLFMRRHNSVSFRYRNATISTWFHRTLVDSVFHPKLISHFPKHKKPPNLR